MQILQQQFEGKPFRMIERDGQHWFVLADVCAALELTTPHKVAYRLDEDEKGRNLIPTPGGEQEMTVINESGLYAVILRSDKAQARPFRKWITNEVLPALRTKGSYSVGKASTTPALISGRQIAAAMQVHPKTAVMRMNRSGIVPTHHFLESRAHNAAYLWPLASVQNMWPEYAFAPFTGAARPGTEAVHCQHASAKHAGTLPKNGQQPNMKLPDRHVADAYRIGGDLAVKLLEQFLAEELAPRMKSALGLA